MTPNSLAMASWSSDMHQRVAMLEDLCSGAHLHLSSRYLVGRSRSCHLCITKPSISGVHAEIVWDGSDWNLQDLGSRNGTFLDGRKLEPGEHAPLQRGSEIVFGVRRHRFRLSDDAPPRLMATTNKGDVCVAEGQELLCLPSLDSPEITIFRSADGNWVLEDSGGLRELHDQTTVFAGGQYWRVCLPELHSRTRDAMVLATPALTDTALQFVVSRDGEHIELELTHSQRAWKLQARAHAFLLLNLARTRLDDQGQDHLDESEHGWVHREDLLRMLAIDAQLLNLWVYRARRQFADVGVRGSANIIERRASTHQMRVGVPNLAILSH